MTEFISAIIGALAVLILGWVKPQWMIGWLLGILEKKLKKETANVVSNALGLMLIRTGVFALEKIPDTPEVQESLKAIVTEVEKIKKALKEEG